MSSNDFKQRLFTEQSELIQKITKLKNFIISDKYDVLPDIDKKDLKEQLKHMEAYESVLSRRTSRQCI